MSRIKWNHEIFFISILLISRIEIHRLHRRQVIPRGATIACNELPRIFYRNKLVPLLRSYTIPSLMSDTFPSGSTNIVRWWLLYNNASLATICIGIPFIDRLRRFFVRRYNIAKRREMRFCILGEQPRLRCCVRRLIELNLFKRLALPYFNESNRIFHSLDTGNKTGSFYFKKLYLTSITSLFLF